MLGFRAYLGLGLRILGLLGFRVKFWPHGKVLRVEELHLFEYVLC